MVVSEIIIRKVRARCYNCGKAFQGENCTDGIPRCRHCGWKERCGRLDCGGRLYYDDDPEAPRWVCLACSHALPRKGFRVLPYVNNGRRV